MTYKFTFSGEINIIADSIRDAEMAFHHMFPKNCEYAVVVEEEKNDY